MDITNYDNLLPVDRGYGTMAFSAEAAELGIAPGGWPRRIPATIGNGCNFVLQQADAVHAVYAQEFGVIELIVFND